jgi:hypothetical protein
VQLGLQFMEVFLAPKELVLNAEGQSHAES